MSQINRKRRRMMRMDATGIAAGELGGPANDGKAHAAKFSGPRTHRIVPNAGHNLPQEAPEAFAEAVLALVEPAR